jgi:hypothetical protein
MMMRKMCLPERGVTQARKILVHWNADRALLMVLWMKMRVMTRDIEEHIWPRKCPATCELQNQEVSAGIRLLQFALVLSALWNSGPFSLRCKGPEVRTGGRYIYGDTRTNLLRLSIPLGQNLMQDTIRTTPPVPLLLLRRTVRLAPRELEPSQGLGQCL